MIANDRSKALAVAKDTDTKQLKALYKQTGNWGSSKHAGLSGSNPNEISDFFANIASDTIYGYDSVMQTAGTPSNGPGSRSAVTYTAVEI